MRQRDKHLRKRFLLSERAFLHAEIGLQLAQAQKCTDTYLKLVIIKRLGQILHCAQLKTFHDGLFIGARTDKNHRRVVIGFELTHDLQQRNTVHFREHHIKQYDVVRILPVQHDRLFGASCFGKIVTLRTQYLFYYGTVRYVIVNYKYFGVWHPNLQMETPLILLQIYYYS